MPSRPRIVSLLPSATEIVCALGAQAQLVGVSHECDFPAGVAELPRLTSARIDSTGTSRAIDAAVRGVIGSALSIYTVDDARLAALAPDIIVTQDLCEVCAVSLDDVRAAVARLAHRDRVDIISLSPTRLAGVLDDIERVALGLGISSRGTSVRKALQMRIWRLAARATTRATTSVGRPRVATLEWIDPLMIGGTWMPELVELAGGQAVGATAGAPAPTVSVEELVALRPEVVVIKPCGFTVARTLAERPIIERSVVEPLAGRARVYATDGNAFFNRPGPRLVESLEILAACIHPEAFDELARQHADVIVRLA
jgi:iron complex transport system substrate-binding protein|nr:BtuF-related (seleno)protein [Kofleriaceae bacterium]